MSKIGYAVDLGTTTIDTCLFDTETKQIIAKASCKNRQSLYGSDVLNRILNVTRKPSLEKTLKALTMDDIEKMLKAMIAKTKPSVVKGTYIQNISISSTMGPGIKINVNSFDI